MLLRTKPTTLLQIFYKYMLISEVFFKSIIGPDYPGLYLYISRHEWVKIYMKYQ